MYCNYDLLTVLNITFTKLYMNYIKIGHKELFGMK